MINKQVATETQRVHRGPQSREIAPGPLAIWLERAILGALFLFVIAAPTSIAATQTAWLLGMLFWVLRLMVWPRPKVHRTTIDYAASRVSFTPVDYQPQDVLQGILARLQGGAQGKKVLAPSALWGLNIDKLAADEADGGRGNKSPLHGPKLRITHGESPLSFALAVDASAHGMTTLSCRQRCH